MFEKNIYTVFNPFTCKIYDKEGNEVEETYWRHYTPTGEKLTRDEANTYLDKNYLLNEYKMLYELWIEFCKKFITNESNHGL